MFTLLAETLRFVYNCAICFLLDTVVFFCVDKLCKLLLRECRTVNEKRQVWMLESLTLIIFSAMIYAYHHFPYILLVLALITLTFAMCLGYVDVIVLWEKLRGYWNEFNDHEESMDEINTDKAIYPQVSTEQVKDFNRRPDPIIIQQIPDPAASSSSARLGEGLTTLRYNANSATYEYVPPSKRNIYRRRALHPGESSSPVSTSNVIVNLENFGTRMWSVLGFSQQHLPPGLSNPGRNLCFLNVVLQCMARAPNLADELSEDAKSCRSCDDRRLVLLDSVSEVLQQLNVTPEENTLSIVDTSNLRDAGCELNPDVLCKDGALQTQQDACEFLVWLLGELHDTINEFNGTKKKWVFDNSLSALKLVYGNISEAHTQVMIQECRAQMNCARSMADPQLAEPLQNLANLDWISHKRANLSVIDNLFTGQSVDIQMCSNCNHISVSTSTFNVLSLPIEAGTQQSLHDCIKAYAAPEKMLGKDGFQCDWCHGREPHTQTPGISRMAQLAQAELDAIPVSPIVNRTSTSPQPYKDFLSSTPLPGSGSKSAPDLRSRPCSRNTVNGERRCLLRRLPECVTIQLMRFSFNPFSKRVHKENCAVNVPLTDLDLSCVMYDFSVEREDLAGILKQNSYSLYGVILHIGGDNTTNGHYTAYCKASNRLWYKFDDEKVTPVEDMRTELQKRHIQENIYVLFYARHHAVL